MNQAIKIVRSVIEGVVRNDVETNLTDVGKKNQVQIRGLGIVIQEGDFMLLMKDIETEKQSDRETER